jgi:hypothetical protein
MDTTLSENDLALTKKRRQIFRNNFELFFDDPFVPDNTAQENERPRKGSRPGRKANIDREHEAGHLRLYQDYFSFNPTYNDKLFKRRFRMERPLFLSIVEALSKHDWYFTKSCVSKHLEL